MALETYNRKRDFSKTTEPRGRAGRKKIAVSGNSYVIQKHDARRLHYDFRLELDGVLKSWAVTKGPSLIAGEKRQATADRKYTEQTRAQGHLLWRACVRREVSTTPVGASLLAMTD